MEAGLQVAVTPVTLPAVATVMVVEPLFVVSCVEVAVIVTCVVKGTFDAVNSPAPGVIAPPPLAVQETTELKLPVPETVAVHWLVWPETIAVGLQLAPTVKIVEVVVLLPPLLLPHATKNVKQHAAAKSPKSRTLSPLLYFGDIDALGNHGRNIRAAAKTSHVSALVEDES